MTYRSLARAIVFVILAGGLLTPPCVQAQGNGRPKAPKNRTTPTPSTSTPTSTGTTSSPSATTTTPSPSQPAPEILAPALSYRQFGAWLDDASASTRGEGYTSIGVGYWRMSGSSQTNIPMLGVGFGVTDRLGVSASVPFYHVSYDGTSTRGMDDVYLGAKYTLVDPTLTISEFGLAINPVMEVLSGGAPDGRVHFAIPVSMELRRAPFRLYGSAGYFTRGSVFTGGAIEWTTPSRLMISGGLTQSYSLKEDSVLDEQAIGRQRVDLTTTVAYPLATVSAVYMSVGRSLTSLEEGGTSLALSGGVTFRFASSGARP